MARGRQVCAQLDGAGDEAADSLGLPVPFWCGGVGSPKVVLGAKVVLAPCVRKDCTWLAAARMLGRPLSALLAASAPFEASAGGNIA